MTIAEQLTASLAAHQAALQARQHRDFVTAHEQLEIAYHLRRDAHAADPQHTDPAWQAEARKTPRGRDTHTELMAFYHQQLGLEDSSDARDQQPAAESATQPGESKPITPNPARAKSEQSATVGTTVDLSGHADATAPGVR